MRRAAIPARRPSPPATAAVPSPPATAAVPPPLVLAAHGSRDPASATTMRALAGRVARRWQAPVVAAFLDFDEPSIPDAVTSLPPGPAPVVVPALLTHAYHGRVDLPAVLAATPRPAVLAEVLGPDPLLLNALCARLSALDTVADGVVLLAAGTSDQTARSTVDDVAARLGRLLGVSCVAGYASASAPTVGDAMSALRADGASRIVAASYFLAPGLLYSAASRTAVQAGALGVAAPLGSAEDVVRLVVTRATAALRPPAMAPDGTEHDETEHDGTEHGGTEHDGTEHGGTKKAPVGVPGQFSSCIGAVAPGGVPTGSGPGGRRCGA